MAEESGFDSRMGLSLEPTQTDIHWYRDCFPGSKASGPLTTHLHIMPKLMCGRMPSLPPYAFMRRCLIKHKAKFIYLFYSGRVTEILTRKWKKKQSFEKEMTKRLSATEYVCHMTIYEQHGSQKLEKITLQFSLNSYHIVGGRVNRFFTSFVEPSRLALR
jgi:hypothetical protein